MGSGGRKRGRKRPSGEGDGRAGGGEDAEPDRGASADREGDASSDDLFDGSADSDEGDGAAADADRSDLDDIMEEVLADVPDILRDEIGGMDAREDDPHDVGAETPDGGAETPDGGVEANDDSDEHEEGLVAAAPDVEEAPAVPAAIVPEPPPPCWERLALPGLGSVTWYRSNYDFVGACCDGRHGGVGKCKKTRTSVISHALGARFKPAQGRPLGHIMAWLLAHDRPELNDQKDHHGYRPDFATRKAARAELKKIAGSEKLFNLEREKAEGEDSEPEGLP